MGRDILLYEFRSFGLNFGGIEEKMNEVAANATHSESYDYYILSEANSKYNVLIRNKMLVIKELLRSSNGFERWNVNLAAKFPVSAEIIENEFFPSLGLEAPSMDKPQYGIRDFVENIIDVDPDIKIVEVYKKKTEFLFQNCNCEMAENTINGAFIKTFNIESDEIANIIKTKETFGIDDDFENISYPQAIKRIIGLEPIKEYKF